MLHGTRTYLLQDSEGQIEETHSISAGLDYPGVGPEHAWLKDTGRAEYHMVTDSQALEAMQTLSRTEGIIPALEPSHAIYYGEIPFGTHVPWCACEHTHTHTQTSTGMQLAKGMSKDKIVLINCCGRGDKDMITVAKALGVNIDLSKEGQEQGRENKK